MCWTSINILGRELSGSSFAGFASTNFNPCICMQYYYSSGQRETFSVDDLCRIGKQSHFKFPWFASRSQERHRHSDSRGQALERVRALRHGRLYPRNQPRTYLLNQSIVRCQARSAAALLYRSGVASQLKPCTAPG
jgi:hypothetical protein